MAPCFVINEIVDIPTDPIHRVAKVAAFDLPALEREALLKRNREIRAELAQIERNIRELEAQLPIEDQLSLNCGVIEANIPELSGRVRVKIRY